MGVNPTSSFWWHLSMSLLLITCSLSILAACTADVRNPIQIQDKVQKQ